MKALAALCGALLCGALLCAQLARAAVQCSDGATEIFPDDAASGLGVTLLSNGLLGTSAVFIGDLDGNGAEDLAVGAPGEATGSQHGRVYILFMEASGAVGAVHTISDATTPALNLDAGDKFGSALEWLSLGGTQYLAVGASNDDDGASDAGALYLLQLNSTGAVLNSTKRSNSGGLPFTLSADVGFGSAVAALGDLDGDGACPWRVPFLRLCGSQRLLCALSCAEQG